MSIVLDNRSICVHCGFDFIMHPNGPDYRIDPMDNLPCLFRPGPRTQYMSRYRYERLKARGELDDER